MATSERMGDGAPSESGRKVGHTAGLLSDAGVEKLAAVIVAGMIREAAYIGHTVDAREIAATVEADPEGETAAYFRISAISALEWIEKFRVNPELLDVFGDRQHG